LPRALQVVVPGYVLNHRLKGVKIMRQCEEEELGYVDHLCQRAVTFCRDFRICPIRSQ
jgi:hypothetical protein